MNISKNKWFKFFFFKGTEWALAGLALCLVFASYLGSVTPRLITELSTHFIDNSLFDLSLKLLLFNFLFIYVNRVAYQLLVNKYVRLLIQNARFQVFTRWLDSNEDDSDKYPQGEILSRIMSDTDAIRELITSGSFGIIIDLFFVLSCLYGFLLIHFKMGLFLSFAEVIATLILIWGSRFLREYFMKLRNSQAAVNRVTANVLGGFHQIYYTRHNNYASTKSSKTFDAFLDNQNQVNTLDAAYYAIAESLYPILLAFIIFVFPYTGLTQAALIFATVDLIQRSINPIKEISGKIANIQRALAGIDRIQQFYNDISGSSEKNILVKHKQAFKEMRVDVEFFEYFSKKESGIENRERFTLSDIKFKGSQGELIGIVGLSGSGKSTLLKILSGQLFASAAHADLIFGEASQNEDLIISLKDFTNYRQEVSIVSQDSHIFTESLLFNITLERTKPKNFDNDWSIIKQNIPYLDKWGYNLDDRILPHKLSLGQRQLLAGVRACYLRKNIVFFDEISSALDSDLEFALRKLVTLIQKNSLTIIVAHRIETIINANKILLLDQGRLIGSGTHHELMASSKIYLDFIKELSHS